MAGRSSLQVTCGVAVKAVDKVLDSIWRYFRMLKTAWKPPAQVTCGVAVKVVNKVLDSIRRACKRGGVRARLITSGDGEWRYLDIVSDQAVSVFWMLSAVGVNCRRAG